MNTGEQVLEYLYHTQLQVDDRSPVRTEKGFTERCYLDPALAWARLSPSGAGRL